ncbi:MAG: hypothetical protein ACM359_01285 [Bacillota bacterium]
MRRRWTGPLLVVLVAFAGHARAQYDAPIEALTINATKAYTWVDGETNVAMLEGPITITADKNRLTAQQAVIWVTPMKGVALDQDRVEIALIGDANLVLPNSITRSGPRLYIEAQVRGSIRVAAPRVGGNKSDSDLYRVAGAIRPTLLQPGQPSGHWIIQDDGTPDTQPTTQPAEEPVLQPVAIQADQFSTTLTPEGTVAAIFTGNVSLFQKSKAGDAIELMANRVVVFTPFPSMMNIPQAEQIKTIEQAVTGVYLEGDVRIVRSPGTEKQGAEQRLTANRAFYDFTTDRAVLTDVILHTVDPKMGIPFVVRAQTMRQLSFSPTRTEYTAEKVQLSSSSFHTPTYHIGASSAYIRQTQTGDEFLGTRTTFVAHDATFNLQGVPFFYLPAVGGSLTERSALRRASIASGNQTGVGFRTEWGLFETFGRMPPENLDVSYVLDYFSDRGPATGVDAKYSGGFVEERTLEPWSFSGDFTSYVINDHGEDDLGKKRVDVDPPDDLRGRFYWRHQHFFPGDWQVQLTAGYISDPTFLEEWYRRDFDNDQPLQTSLYLKRQRDTEAITFLASVQPNDFVTVADLYQEQFEVERLPEVGYRRIGDSVLEDRMTFFSANTLAGLRYNLSNYSLEELGFRTFGPPLNSTSPGMPSLGLPYDLNTPSLSSGLTEDVIYRGDFRQELDWPFNVGKFRVVPYVIGRYTEYSEAVDGSALGRLYMGGGVRANTAFWKVDDTVQSDLFDLHRLRHVIEPQLNLYSAVQSEDRTSVFIYDEPVDAITDISAMQWALNQRWQTKRGGPGNWRSVDFFTFNVAWNYFFSQPPDVELNPTNFRGIYYASVPEASIARNSVNMDADWRVSDALDLLGDVAINTDSGDLATATIGLQVRQTPRVSYYVGLRHIGDITLEDVNTATSRGQIFPLIKGNFFEYEDQDLVLLGLDYALSPKYRLSVGYSYDLAQSRNVRSVIALTRQFDRLFVSVSARTDNIENDSAFMVNVWPAEIRPPVGSQSAQNYFRP